MTGTMLVTEGDGFERREVATQIPEYIPDSCDAAVRVVLPALATVRSLYTSNPPCAVVTGNRVVRSYAEPEAELA